MKIKMLIKNHPHYSEGEHEVDDIRGNYLVRVGAAEEADEADNDDDDTKKEKAEKRKAKKKEKAENVKHTPKKEH